MGNFWPMGGQDELLVEQMPPVYLWFAYALGEYLFVTYRGLNVILVYFVSVSILCYAIITIIYLLGRDVVCLKCHMNELMIRATSLWTFGLLHR